MLSLFTKLRNINTTTKKIIFIIFCILLLLYSFYYYCLGLNNLEMIDLSENGFPSTDPHSIIDINSAHIRSKRHRGCWVFVVNEYQQFLFVKRSENHKTCPATWSVVGEHTKFGESYLDCAKRAIKEEISVLTYSNLQPIENGPVFLHFNYGDRVDKQWTQSYSVVVQKNKIRMSDIHEASDVTWVNFTEADYWLHQCPNGVCRYCNPSKVWKMYQNHTFSYYYSLIEMTVEYLHATINININTSISLN